MLRPDQIVKTGCPLCGHGESKIVCEVFDHEFQTTEQKFPLNECLNCGGTYLSPRPGLNALDVIYPANYANYHTGEEEGKSYVRMISNLLQGRRLKRTIQENTSVGDKFTVLDAGCGDGFSLDRIMEQFPGAQTFGVEPNEGAARHAGKRHKVFQGIFEDFETDERFDVIVSSHVIEHVEDPVRFLKKIHGLLKESGVAIIDTPNTDCLQARIFKRNWGGIHAPRHWTLFSTKTLAYACERAGFKVQRLVELPINIFWIWSVHSRLYESPGKRKFADRFFNTVDCVGKKSAYYLGIMIIAELLERGAGLLGLGLGQQRAIVKRAS